MFEYYFEISESVWIVLLDREQEVDRFTTEEEAKAFCDENNGQLVGA